MDTPSSTRRVATSQDLFAIIVDDLKFPFSSNNTKTEDSGICHRKKVEEDRCALMDITNDSPIVGLAMQTPPSGFMSKRKRSRIKNTPGSDSGEALLRGQVKTLLHKGTYLTHSLKSLPFPANTPHFPNFSYDQVQIKIASPVLDGLLRVEVKEEKSMSITRSLLLDFADKSESLEEEKGELDNLCVGIRNMTPAGFAGKQSRFVCKSEAKQVLQLKGIPTPRGKHLRFDDTQHDDESS